MTLRTSASLLHALWKAKRTLRSATSLLHALRKSNHTLRSSTNRFAEVKPISLNVYKPPTHFAEDKTDSLVFASLIHALRKSKRTLWSSTSLLHALRKSKWSSPNFCKHPTCFAVVKPYPSQIYKPGFVCEKWLSELLQSSYTLCGRQYGVFDLQQTYTLCGDKSDSPIFDKPTTRFAETKCTLRPSTNLLNALWKFKSALPSSTNLLCAFFFFFYLFFL